MDEEVVESLAYCESTLRRAGVDPLPLAEQASRLADLPGDSLKQAVKEFSVAANGYFSAADSDYGALLLESLADATEDPTRKRVLYEEAAARASIFASWATSGSEGMARSVDVERIAAKLAATT